MNDEEEPETEDDGTPEVPSDEEQEDPEKSDEASKGFAGPLSNLKTANILPDGVVPLESLMRRVDHPPEPVRRFELPAVAKRVDALRAYGLLVVECLDAEILQDAGAQVIELCDLDGREFWELRAARAEDTGGPDELPGFDSVKAWHARREGATRTLTVIHVHERDFRDSLPESPELLSDRERGQHLFLCLVYPDSTTGHKNGQETRWTWSIDFLHALLRAHQTSESPALGDIVNLIEQQADSWPEDPRLFYLDVKALLADKGYEGFADVVLTMPARPEPVPELSDLENASAAKTAAMFTATYFPGLSMQEYLMVMRILLEEEVEYYEEIAPVQGENGATDLRPVPREKNAWEYWLEKRNGDRILFESKLVWSRNHGQAKTIGFADGRHGRRVQNTLEAFHGLYLYEKFDRLYRSGCLFLPETSDTLARCLIQIAGRMALDYYKDRGVRLLTETVSAIRNTTTQEQVELATLAEVVPEIVHYLANMAESGRRTAFFYERLADLCAELLGQKDTREAAGKFIGVLKSGDPGAADILWRVARRLRKNEHIDYFALAKHALGCGKARLRLHVLRALLNDAAANDAQLRIVMAQARSWHPGPALDRPPTVPERYALALLFEILQSERALQERSPKNAVQSGLRMCDLLAPETFPEEDATEVCAAWLLHPELPSGVRLLLQDIGLQSPAACALVLGIRQEELNEIGDTEGTLMRALKQVGQTEIVAEMLESWSHVIEGPSDSIDKRFAALLDHLRERTPRELKKGLNGYWLRKEDALLDEAESVVPTPENRDERAALRDARQRIVRLRHAII